MGTRNITAVYLDGEYKVAQYGQWDGYPEGHGMTTLEFARTIVNRKNREEFAEKVRSCRWIKSEEIDSINAKIRSGEITNWQKEYPELSRDTGAEILGMIFRRGGLALNNEIDFIADGLFCEWVWLIDLDKNTFEGFSGFNQVEANADSRFDFLKEKCRDGYCTPVKVCEYSLNDLPSDDEFLAQCQ